MKTASAIVLAGLLVPAALAASDFAVRFLPSSSPTYPSGYFWAREGGYDYAAETGDPAGPFNNKACIFRGFVAGGSSERIEDEYLIYRMRLDFVEDVYFDSFSEFALGIQRSSSFLRVLDTNLVTLRRTQLAEAQNARVTNRISVGLTGRSFVLDCWDQSTYQRWRQGFTASYVKLGSLTTPVVHHHPSSQEAFSGTDVAMGVVALGPAPLRYQWQFNGTNLRDGGRVSGSGTNSLRISAVSPEDAGAYAVVVQNLHGPVTSDPAELTVLVRPPVITAEAGAQTVFRGAAATFAVTVTGSLPMTFQWRRNGVDLSDGGRIAGAHTASLSIAPACSEDIGVYTVVICNAHGSVISAPANLTVTDFTVTFLPSSSATYPSGYFWAREGGYDYAAETGDPAGPFNNKACIFRGYAGGGSSEGMDGQYLIYRMRLDFPEDVYFDSFSECAQGIQTSSSFFRILDTNMVTLLSTRLADAPNRRITNHVAVGLFGRSFILDSWDESTFQRWRQGFTVSSVKLGPSPAILHHPVSQEVLAGTDVEMGVDARGEAPLGYQWQFSGAKLQDGGRISGSATSTLRISAVSAEDAGAYTVVVQNLHGSVTSNPANLTVLIRPPAITAEAGAQTVFRGAAATFAVTVTGSLPMTFQWRRNGIDLGDGGRIAGAQTASLSIAAAGTEDLGVYTVVIRNAYGSVTSNPATLSVVLAPPTIASQPQGHAVALGSTVSLEVQAAGSLPLSYQWQREGIDVIDEPHFSGARTGTLTISELSLADLGSYSVVIENSHGRVQSKSAAVATFSVVLQIRRDGDQVVLTWNEAGRGMKLQKASRLPSSEWQDVPGSDVANTASLPLAEGTRFFRLVREATYPSAGLVAWWPGDGDASDVVGGNDGTLMNGVSFTAGIVRQAFLLEAGAYIAIPDNPALAISASMPSTLCNWIFLASLPDDAVPLTLTRAFYYGMIYSPLVFGGLRAHVHDGESWHFIDVPFSIQAERWYHVAQVWDGTTMQVYVDGDMVGEEGAIVNYEPRVEGSTCLGRWDLNPGRDQVFPFWGLLDEALLYSRALSAEEIRVIYDAGSAGKAADERGSRAVIRLDPGQAN